MSYHSHKSFLVSSFNINCKCVFAKLDLCLGWKLSELLKVSIFVSSTWFIIFPTHTNSPSFSLVWISAHDLWSCTATALRLRGETPFKAPGDAGISRPVDIEALRREAIICLPPPIILFRNKQLKLFHYSEKSLDSSKRNKSWANTKIDPKSQFFNVQCTF